MLFRSGLCAISDDELRAMIAPSGFVRPAEPVPQPSLDSTAPRMAYSPDAYARLMSLDDAFVWDNMSETTPPVEP